MPYTPPSQRSPIASGKTTPSAAALGSSGNKQQSNAPPSQSTTTTLPRSSSSYLSRHRRSPSLTKPTATFSIGPDEKINEVGKNAVEVDGILPNGSLAARDKTNESPPTSSPSDEEGQVGRGRLRDPPNLKELQAAIMIIEQRRESSPERVSEERIKARATLGLGLPRIDPLAKEHATEPKLTAPLPLSETARKISHSRSSTDMSALLDIPRNEIDTPTRSASESDLDDLDDDINRARPIPVRKKSGELVKPVLSRGGLRRRPSSMPGTPTYSKAVHFDPTSLENIRTFCGNDRPIVVSAGTSPAEQYLNDIEFPFGDDPAENRKPAFEWEIRLSNFPGETIERNLAPVRVERIYLSADNKNLMGAIAVVNLAFRKTVVARFTLDYWKTTSEVVADYNNDVRRKQLDDGHDRFLFSIKLEDQAHLENKTMFFCVRYNVNGQEYWDNNNSINYQVDFAKKPKETKQGTQGTSRPLPRSKPSDSTSSVRPRSFPSALDDFGDFGNFDTDFEFPSFKAPPAQVVGDSPIRFKNQKPAQELAADAPAQRSSASNQAFGNRYNFGVSLHNAIAAASPGLGERGDPKYKAAERSAASQKMSFAKQPIVESGSMPSVKAFSHGVLGDQKDPISSNPSEATAKPAALAAEKPSLQSKSYQELLNSYCFYGTNKSAQKTQAVASAKCQSPAHLDGAVDEPIPPKSEPESKPDPVPAKLQTKSEPKAQPLSEEIKTPPRVTSPRLPRGHPPATGSSSGSRAASPVFGYPFTKPMQNGLFSESHTPTAIRGQ
ncbi:MAG: hypothetical protein Q9188_002845 [Gyalolechia gomerana]